MTGTQGDFHIGNAFTGTQGATGEQRGSSFWSRTGGATAQLGSPCSVASCPADAPAGHRTAASFTCSQRFRDLRVLALHPALGGRFRGIGLHWLGR